MLPLPPTKMDASRRAQVSTVPQVPFRALGLSVWPNLPRLFVESVRVGNTVQPSFLQSVSTVLLPPVPWCTTHDECRANLQMAQECYEKTGTAERVRQFQRSIAFDTCQISQLMTINLYNDSDEDLPMVQACFYGIGAL